MLVMEGNKHFDAVNNGVAHHKEAAGYGTGILKTNRNPEGREHTCPGHFTQAQAINGEHIAENKRTDVAEQLKPPQSLGTDQGVDDLHLYMGVSSGRQSNGEHGKPRHAEQCKLLGPGGDITKQIPSDDHDQNGDQLCSQQEHADKVNDLVVKVGYFDNPAIPILFLDYSIIPFL